MKVLSGFEPLKSNGKPTGKCLIDFWKWNSSDLLNNTMRGAFAEFIVATALGIDISKSHIDWESCDLIGPNGERIEVKCSAYLQSWFPKDKPDRLSRIVFSISPALYWIPDECKYQRDSCGRHSDVYVFCHYKSTERKPENPLNLDNWDFYVASTKWIDETFGSQRNLPLHTLTEKYGRKPCGYNDLKTAVSEAVLR